VSARAKELADEFRETTERPGFKMLWAQYLREVRRAEVWVQNCPTKGASIDQVAMELAMRQGFLAGVRELARVIPEIQEELDNGRIPWERT
jgi:hypothetical protein